MLEGVHEFARVVRAWGGAEVENEALETLESGEVPEEGDVEGGFANGEMLNLS